MTASPTAESTADRRSAANSPWLAFIALALIGGALLTLSLTATPGPNTLWPRWLAMMMLAWWLPGVLLIAHWRLPGLNAPTAGMLALGAGLGWLIALTLIIHWWPGKIEFWPMTLIFAAGASALALALFWRRPRQLQSTDRRTWAWLAALTLLAVILRLPGLAYHEFHYDEVLVLTRAKEAIRGEDDAFARHTKGPGEIAVATVVYRTLGMANERTARLPFGIASVGSVLALALLGQALFAGAERAGRAGQLGFWSGLLLAFNGFALGLSRIVQYQAAMLLLMPLAVLTAWRFAIGGRARWLALSGILSAFGLVLHYEFGLLTPALLWLTWLGWQRSPDRRAVINTVIGTGAVGACVVAGAYLPMLLNPYVATTQGYLGTRMGNVGSTFNLAFFIEMGTFYNSIYFFVGLIALAVVGIVVGWRWRWQAALTLILWFTPFLVLYFFIIQFPGTHFYLLMPSWSILAALPLALISDGFISRVRAGPRASAMWRGLVLLAIVLWLAISGWYLHTMFFRQEPEYLVNYADERIRLFWAPYGEEIPEKPRFGFPINEGWKTLGVLSEWKYLNGTYASNERSRHLRWYSGDFDRVPFEEEPDFIFVARHLQEPDPAFNQERLNDYAQVGEVLVRGEPRIAIWARTALPAPFLTYDAEQFVTFFDGVGPTFSEWPEPRSTIAETPLGEQITLVQAGIDSPQLSGGEALHVYLVWRAETDIDQDYKLFVHIADAAGQPVAQWDGFPGLNTVRTSNWVTGDSLDDHVLITIPKETLPGSYRVLVGLYDGQSGERLGGRAIEIGSIDIKQ